MIHNTIEKKVGEDNAKGSHRFVAFRAKIESSPHSDDNRRTTQRWIRVSNEAESCVVSLRMKSTLDGHRSCLIFRPEVGKEIYIVRGWTTSNKKEDSSTSGDLSTRLVSVRAGLAILMRKSTAWMLQWSVNGNGKLINIYSHIVSGDVSDDSSRLKPHPWKGNLKCCESSETWNLIARPLDVAYPQPNKGKQTHVYRFSNNSSEAWALNFYRSILWKLSFKYANSFI